jgi:hypothetical protein
MGDRANVLVKDSYDDGVFLYTHWEGYDLPLLVRKALATEERWSDSSYLARIVFSAMVKEDIDGSTGYGISSRLTDNEYPVIVLDADARRVSYVTEAAARDKDTSKPVASWSMEQYITVPEEEIQKPFRQE